MTNLKASINQLEIVTSAGEPLANRFICQSRSADCLAFIFPGLLYNCDKPLLYYTSQTLATRGVDVLQSWVDYNQKEFESFSQTDRTSKMVGDAQTILKAGLQARPYNKFILVGKSIGTLIMAFLLSQEYPCEIGAGIWLTPLLQIPFVTAAVQNNHVPAIVVGGTNDNTFDPASVAVLKGLPNLSLLCIEGANHSLEIPGDPRRSLIALSNLVECIFDLAI